MNELTAHAALWRRLRPVFLAVTVFAASLVCIALPRHGPLAPAWLANAVTLAVLLRTGAGQWPLLIAADLCGNLAAELTCQVPLASALGFVFANGAEILVAARLLAWRLGPSINFSRLQDLLNLAAACLAAVCVSSLISATALLLIEGAPVFTTLRTWGFAHMLGLVTVAPCLSIVLERRKHLAGRLLRRRGAATGAALLAPTLAVFAQTRFPLFFLILPPLLLASLELETFGAAAGVLIVEGVALTSLFTGTGPLTLIHGDSLEKAMVMQLFLFSALITSLPIAVLNLRRREAMSALATSEARYRRLADNASDIVTEADLTGRFSYVSPAVETMTGFSVEEVLGRRAIDLVHVEDRERVRAEIREALRQPGGRRVEHRHVARDGRVLWIELRPAVARDPASGAPIAITDVLRDVTARKELEAALQDARIAAEAATVAKSDFLSNMSHELRTPLTSILGFSSLLAGEGQLTEQSQRWVSRIKTSSQALLSIVNDILDISKLDAGQVELDPRPVALAGLLSECVGLLEPQADAKGVRLEGRLRDLPGAVILDDGRLRQVLTNLIGNALKFTAEGSVTVTAVHDGQRLRCEIADTGSGISEGALGRLFQRFSQADASTTRAFGGTGLGLAICKGLVEAMGGKIGATSRLGLGSVFWFELPCPAADPAALTGTDSGSAAGGLQGVRLLIADDNEINREIVRLMLTPLGVEVTEAGGGEEAVRIAHEAPFDVILMDVRMPGMDGGAAARAIRSGGGPNDMVPILAFTAAVLDASLLQDPDTPFCDRLEKPIVAQRLIETIRHWAAPEGLILSALPSQSARPA